MVYKSDVIRALRSYAASWEQPLPSDLLWAANRIEDADELLCYAVEKIKSLKAEIEAIKLHSKGKQ